ncbi:MAG: F0F1 ATP synthase subunit epsilon [Alphaproteobacteria bacterium]
MRPLLQCHFIAPAKKATVDDLDLVTLPGDQGEFGVLPHHAPMLVALTKGIVRLHRKQDVFQYYFIESGFASISKKTCTISCENFSLLNDLDPKVLEADLKRYHDDLAGLTIEDDRRSLQNKIVMVEEMLEAWKKQSMNK